MKRLVVSFSDGRYIRCYLSNMNEVTEIITTLENFAKGRVALSYEIQDFKIDKVNDVVCAVEKEIMERI